MILVALYLLAIVLANLSVAYFGASATIVNAFLFIGLDITTRDKLHDSWEHKHLWRNMALLVLSGSILSALLNWQATPIAIASCVAFGVSGIVDTLIYTLLGNRAKWVKVNGSNVVSALADSFIFPYLAFGAFLPLIVAGQWVAKVLGGFVWSLILGRYHGNSH